MFLRNNFDSIKRSTRCKEKWKNETVAFFSCCGLAKFGGEKRRRKKRRKFKFLLLLNTIQRMIT